MQVRIRPLVTGLASYIPGLYGRIARSGGSSSATYCYEVWIKHLTFLHRAGLQRIPAAIAELGPGDSLGSGIAALLSGVETYHALDVRKWSNTERDLEVLDELVELFRARAGVPGIDGYPCLVTSGFPGSILTDERLAESLREDRIDSIRRAIETAATTDSAGPREPEGARIRYIVPWSDPGVLAPRSVDLIFSQAVLQHVDDLEAAYAAMTTWLKPGGYMSHEIDFRCHKLTRDWNGHWACNDLTWKLVRGKKPYLLNRQPYSAHVRLLEKYGCKVVANRMTTEAGGIPRTQLAGRWREMTRGDLSCATAHVQAVRTRP
jgi:hypothetical protein